MATRAASAIAARAAVAGRMRTRTAPAAATARRDAAWKAPNARRSGAFLKELLQRKGAEPAAAAPSLASGSGGGDSGDIGGEVSRESFRQRPGLVFQLRKSDPKLAEYYRTLFEHLSSQGVTKFGNQDYSK